MATRRVFTPRSTGIGIADGVLVAAGLGLLANSTARPRLYAVLLAVFLGLAVSLAALGIYGVVAYAAARRSREIGIRIALGARRVDVTRSMLGQSAVFIGLGVALGLVGSAATTPWLRGLLFGLGPLDAPTFVTVKIALAGIAALARICRPAAPRGRTR